jgi:hypothetical protein
MIITEKKTLKNSHWNSQLPPPAIVISWRHFDWSKESKLSSKINWPEQIDDGALEPLTVVTVGEHAEATLNKKQKTAALIAILMVA